MFKRRTLANSLVALSVILLVATAVRSATGDPTTAAATQPALSDEQCAKTAKALASKVAAATISQDFEKVVALTYPAVIDQLGGRKAAIEVMTEGEKKMSDQGISFKTMTIDDVSQVLWVKGRCYAVVPNHLIMGTPQGDIRADAAVLGISDDGGRAWTFVSVNKPSDIQKMFPAVAAQLRLSRLKVTKLEPTTNPAH
jgi:hypothetical protein